MNPCYEQPFADFGVRVKFPAISFWGFACYCELRRTHHVTVSKMVWERRATQKGLFAGLAIANRWVCSNQRMQGKKTTDDEE